MDARLFGRIDNQTPIFLTPISYIPIFVHGCKIKEEGDSAVKIMFNKHFNPGILAFIMNNNLMTQIDFGRNHFEKHFCT